MPFTKATVAVVGNPDFVKAMKEGINDFSEGMPIIMGALHGLESHTLIGGEIRPMIRICRVTGEIVVVQAFKTGFELEQKRHTNDKKVISLYVGMKDMMEVLIGYMFILLSTAVHSRPAA
jgi:hypothetical protein